MHINIMAKFSPTIVGSKVIHAGKGHGDEYVLIRAEIDFHFIGSLEEYKKPDGSIDRDRITYELKKAFQKEDRSLQID